MPDDVTIQGNDSSLSQATALIDPNNPSNQTTIPVDPDDSSIGTTALVEPSNQSNQTSTQNGPSGQSGAVVDQDPDYMSKILTGMIGLHKLSEAVSLVAQVGEAFFESIEPIGAILEVGHMVLAVWEALETPDRTCGYQGLVYGLMYITLDMGTPQPNPTWPDVNAAPEHDAKFAEGVDQAKKCLADGQTGVRRRNVILLDVAKRGEKAVINDLWQHAISDDDHLLRMFTIGWPKVDPNG